MTSFHPSASAACRDDVVMTSFHSSASAARRRRVFRVRLPVLLLYYALIGSSAALVKELHYGRDGGLEIECGPDELILIESERLAYSPGGRGSSSSGLGGRCRTDSASCSVPYSQASWYCRGKSSCSGMPVERRPLHKKTCGSEFTNCLRVEYRCVKDTSLTNICSNAVFESTDGGHLVTPRFPDMYPPRRNCTCTITASGSSSDDADDKSSERMRIDIGFFLIKAHAPCQDWLSIQVDSRSPVRRCGYLSNVEPFVGRTAVVNFRSDRAEQDMGFWLHYRNTRPDQKTTLRCGKYAFQKVPITTTPSTTSSSTTSASLTTLMTTIKSVDTTTASPAKEKPLPTTTTTRAPALVITPVTSAINTTALPSLATATAQRAKKPLSKLKPPALIRDDDGSVSVKLNTPTLKQMLKQMKSKDDSNETTLIQQLLLQQKSATYAQRTLAQSTTRGTNHASEVSQRPQATGNDERVVAKSGYQGDNDEAYESYREPLPTPAADHVAELLVDENQKDVNAPLPAPSAEQRVNPPMVSTGGPSIETGSKANLNVDEVNAPEKPRTAEEVLETSDVTRLLPVDTPKGGSMFPVHAAAWTDDLSEVISQDVEVDGNKQSEDNNASSSTNEQREPVEEEIANQAAGDNASLTASRQEVDDSDVKPLGSGFQSSARALTTSSDDEEAAHQQPAEQLERKARGRFEEKAVAIPHRLLEASSSAAGRLSVVAAYDDLVLVATLPPTTTKSPLNGVKHEDMKADIVSVKEQHRHLTDGNSTEPRRSNAVAQLAALDPVDTNPAGERGVMFSKVGLDPPRGQPNEPIHWLDEPFEALTMSNDSMSIDDQFNGTSSMLPFSVDDDVRRDENEDEVASTAIRGRPEAKSHDDDDEISDRNESELSAVLSPKELQWLLSEVSTDKSSSSKTTRDNEENETMHHDVAYSEKRQPATIDLRHMDSSKRSDDFISDVSSDGHMLTTDSETRFDLGDSEGALSAKWTGVANERKMPKNAEVVAVKFRGASLDMDENRDDVKNYVQDTGNKFAAEAHPVLEQQRKKTTLTAVAKFDEADGELLPDSEDLGPPDTVSVRGKSLYNHVDVVPIERDLDKDVVIPLFPVNPDEISHSSSRLVDVEGLNGGVVEHRISPIRNTGAEYFIDRLGHMVNGVTETGEDAIQLSEHERRLFEDNVVEPSVPALTAPSSSDARSLPALAERIHIVLPSDSVAHHRRPVDHSHNRLPSGPEDLTFQSLHQSPLFGEILTAAVTPATLAVQVMTVGGGTLVPNLPEVPAVASHAAYRSPGSSGVGSGSSNIIGGQNIIWAIIVVGTIGWLVFVSMLGVTIYHKRKRRQERLFASTRTPSSSIYSDFHLPTIPGMFPGRPSTTSSSPGATASSTTNTRNPLPAAMNSAASSLHASDDADSLASNGTYGSLNEAIAARCNRITDEDRSANSRRQEQSVPSSKGKSMAPPVPLTRGASLGGATMYDVLPPPLFDVKNQSAALSTVAEVSEQHTPSSTLGFDRCGVSIGRRESNNGMTDFTSKDCGAVSTGWRLHQALASISQSSSASRDGEGGSSVTGEDRKLKKKDSKLSKKQKKNENGQQVPPCPPHPPPPLPGSCSSTVSAATRCNELQPQKANNVMSCEKQKNWSGNLRGQDASSAH